MVGFHRFSQFLVGPTVKHSCIRTGPAGMGLAPLSCSLICSLNAADWLDALMRTVYRCPGRGAVAAGDGALDSDLEMPACCLVPQTQASVPVPTRLSRRGQREQIVVEVALVEERGGTGQADVQP